MNVLKFIVVLINLNFISTQYYQNDYDMAYSKQASKPEEIEQKYVNSGQSVLLVCDLPNSMPNGKVFFIKYDNKLLSSGSDIRVDSDDERFEIGQQYAWEWSLKINSINEEDAGVYFCKVENIIIKQYEIIVRVPPRIKDDFSSGQVHHHKIIREGDNVQFSCFATGVPKPNISWYSISNEDQSLKLLPTQTGSVLSLENLTRYSPKRYQCKASNNIPPSDTRNFTLSIEFAPEIEIQSKMDRSQNIITLNCTIKALPLTNKFFWRKDGNYIQNSMKNEIRTLRVNDFTLIAQVLIKHFNELDHGLYECSAENDLRVSKVVYTLKDTSDQDLSTNMIPIGYANNFRSQEESKLNSLSTSTLKPEHKNNRKANKHQNKKINSEDSFKENSQKRPHQRNNRNQTKLMEKLLPSTIQETTNSYNSPFIIILEDEEIMNNDKLKDKSDLKPKSEDLSKKLYVKQIENTSSSIYLFKCFNLFMFLLNSFIILSD